AGSTGAGTGAVSARADSGLLVAGGLVGAGAAAGLADHEVTAHAAEGTAHLVDVAPAGGAPRAHRRDVFPALCRVGGLHRDSSLGHVDKRTLCLAVRSRLAGASHRRPPAAQ